MTARWLVVAVMLWLSVACGGGGGMAEPPGDAPGVPCPDSLTPGQTCDVQLVTTRALSFPVAPHQYLQLTATPQHAASVTLTGSYDAEALHEDTDGPDLAFYNPGTTMVTAQVVMKGNALLTVTLQPQAFELSTTCTADCGALLQLPLPREADPYRFASPVRYHFGRRELVEAVLATVFELRAETAGLGPVGISDLSQKDGQVPGTDVNGPRHTYPAHSGGYAIDVGYYRANGDNSGEPACPVTDRMFCTGPHDLQLARNAEFFRRISTNLHTVQIIVDPVMEADVRGELARQVSADPMAVSRASHMLQSGAQFQYHADHFHIAFVREPIAVSSLRAHHQAAESSVAIGPNGEVMVAFMLLDDQNAIGYAYSANFGIDWEDTQLLRAPGGRLSNDPSLAVDASGTFYITWLAQRLPVSDAHIYWAKAPAGTGRFGAPGEVSDPAESFGYDRPNLKISAQGTPLVTYARGPAGGESLDSIVVAAARDGTSFTRSVLVGPTPAGFRNFPLICVPPGGNRVYVAYGDAGATWLQSSPDGVQWDAASRVKVFQDTTSDPRVACDGDDLWILDAKAQAFPPAGAPTLQTLLLRHSGDGGQSFDAPVTIADGHGASLFMLGGLAVGGLGQVTVTYYQGSSDGDATAQLMAVRARDRAATQLWPPLTLYGPIVLRTGYGVRWLGDYNGNADVFGALSFSFADNSGDGSQTLFARAILP